MQKSFKSERIKNYINAALKNFFSNETLDQEKINCDDFLNDVITNGDFVGLITEVRKKEMLPEFAHASYGEYFTALHLVKNCKKIANLEDFIFSPKHTNVRFFFDLLMARDSPPHIAVLYGNTNKLSKYNKHLLNSEDLQGRNLLHIACSWSEQYPLLDVKKITDTVFSIDDKSGKYSVKQKDAKNKELLQYLLENCEAEKRDRLFGYTCVIYAEKSGCLSALATVESKHKSDHYKTKSDDFICNMLYYGVKYNFADALDILFDDAKYVLDNNKESLLHIASRNNNTECVQKLLSCNNYRQHIDDKNRNTYTPLHVASEKGHLDVVALLLKNNANINAKNEYGRTSLCIASFDRHVNVLKFLIERGANVDSTDIFGSTPLHTASSNGHLDVATALLENKANIHAPNEIERTYLFLASWEGHVNVVNLLLDHGANVNTPDISGSTPLHVASSKGHLDATILLKINTKDKDGPLSLDGHANVVKVLLKRGANVNTADIFGSTPLHTASSYGHLDIVQVLLENNANIHAKDENRRTSLYFACSDGYVNVVKFLIECGANVNTADIFGSTPLHIASYNGHLHVVKVLLDNNANIHAKNKDDETSLFVASLKGHVDIVKILTEHGANVDTTTFEGLTPLHIASYKGFLNVVRILIESGANPNLFNKYGVTPLLIAFQHSHQDVVNFLLENNPNIDITIIVSLACDLFIAYNKNNNIQ